MSVKQGFGCMGITAFYGQPLPEEEGVKLLKEVFAAGVRHFDTAEIYRSNAFQGKPDENTKFNETVVGKFAAEVGREKVFIATKLFPGLHGDDKMTTDDVLKAVDDSLKRLGSDYIDLYYLHRLPSNLDVTVFMTACKTLVEAGRIKHIGLSEAGPAKIREADAIHKVSYVQQEWSLITRNLEESVVPTCRELAITVVAYSPLARNLLTGVVTEPPADWRANMPRYSPENLKKNVELVAQISALAEKNNCTAAQLSLAWLFAKAAALGVNMIPIPGTTKVKHAMDNIASEKVSLSPEEVAKLEEIGAAVAGERATEQYTQQGIEGQL
uniref:Putative aldo-keto reductase 1-like n=1 Tax=Tetraselmis sp. GSL018 TaxID=582737 RepID=A0A061SAS7_9CHLO|eukprot:CAMPEP_0177591606 /NCGR_PEP_ID=MMETSP0419_2-20121207/8090_1 /TAXON_ID=582737 /ORGANISM="Tetraselmis sp., Strain GSL018" /LENGTH=326 /DNA_ID=CAMNT_0019082365 /DNA_START=81 /DNA_END=1061 /DNA_ORIENTATION=-